jgi:hypothetical protein
MFISRCGHADHSFLLPMATTCVSAPGKVLLAGGYLVLDRAHAGVVVSTSARFYTAIRSGSGAGTVRVRSPQFEGGEWVYALDGADVQQRGCVCPCACGRWTRGRDAARPGPRPGTSSSSSRSPARLPSSRRSRVLMRSATPSRTGSTSRSSATTISTRSAPRSVSSPTPRRFSL